MTIVFSLLLLLALCYVVWHIWTLIPLAAGWKITLLALGFGCIALLFLSVARKIDTLPLTLSQICYTIGTSSVIVILYMMLIFVVLDLGRIVHLVPNTFLYHSWTGTGCILLALIIILICGNIHYRHKERVELELQSQQPLQKTYRAVMLSDMHIGYHNSRQELARWVDMMNQERPDLILIAGDIIDGSMRPLLEEDMAAEFRRLQAPIYACLGNHEYYAGQPEALQFYHDAGIHLLIDEAALIDSTIVVIGRDDRSNPDRKSIAQLMLEAPKGCYTILLDHQPYHLEESEQAGIDFQLSGHTHRGQVWPISWITDAMYECSWGTHQRGNTHYYVSSGMGIWGGKFRIGSQSEYVVATIHS